ncbi:MAG: hypothetical protein ACLS3P_09990 [Agathobacter sp.]|uniref:hypothetical protein n=1 Tax=Agathobacter sp. TaxID=2021311 RepID=UPI003991D0AA
MNTEIANAVNAAGDKAQYDTRVKRLLAQKSILAHILVKTVDEFKGMKPEDVVKYIEGEPSISVVPVEPGLANMEKTDATGQRIVGLNTEHDEKYEMHRLIGALLSSELKEQEKLDIIEHEYNIPISQEFREDVRIMCNLSTGIEERATEKTSEKFILNMYKKGYTLDQIADVAETGVDEVEAIIKRKEPAMA